MNIKINQTDKSKLTEICYLFVLAVYLFFQFLDTTTFQIARPWYTEQAIRAMIVFVVLLKAGYEAKEEGTEWFLCVLAGILYSMSYIFTGYTFLIDTALLMIGAKNIPYRKILKIYIWCGVAVLFSAVLGSMTGCITDLVYNHSRGYRHSFGVVYATDFAAHLAYMILAIWVAYEGIPGLAMSVVGLALAAVAYFGAYAQCGAIVMVLSAFAMIYVSFSDYQEKKGSNISSFLKRAENIFILLIPVCALTMCGLMFFYNSSNPLMAKINSAISGRLQLAVNARTNYGVKLFGTAFDMVGAGGSTVGRSGYNFVDSSYCMIFIRYGVVTFLIVLLLMMRTAWLAKKCRDKRLLAAMALVAIHSMIEHHLLEPSYDVFFFIPFAGFGYVFANEANKARKVNNENKSNKDKEYSSAIFSSGFYACVAFITILAMPVVVSCGKTIVSLLGLYETWRHRYFMAAAVFGLAAYIFICETIRRSILKYLKDKKIAKKQIMLLCIDAAAVICVFTGSRFIIHTQSVKVQETIDAGTKMIDYLASSEAFTGKIYADDYPLIYAEKTGAVSNSILTAESLCTKENIVIITGEDTELRRLTEKNFSFGIISEKEYVYTNSDEAVKLLGEYGIDMSSCFNLSKTVDLQAMADANDLTCTEDGKLLIEGADHSLIHGPWLTIYGGKLRVEYKLKLLETSIESGTVAKIRISSDSGNHICTEQEITRDMFDENNECTYTAEVEIGNSSGMEFLLFAIKDTRLQVDEIRYGKY